MDKKKKKKQAELLDELTQDMNNKIESYKNDPKEEIKFLQFINKFNDYSIRNCALIESQRPGAIGVSSYKDHEKNGYHVQKGEKSLRIFAPNMTKKFKGKDGKFKSTKEATDEEKQLIKDKKMDVKQVLNGYVAVPVFDITQTNCPPEDYPKLYPNKPEKFEFEGTDDNLSQLVEALHDFSEDHDIKVIEKPFNSSAKGGYYPTDHMIQLKPGLTMSDKAYVLLHELAHSQMHRNIDSSALTHEEQSVIEYQAEMTGYLVAQQLGLNTEESAKMYLANWTNRNVGNEDYLNSLEEVKKTATGMTEGIIQKYNHERALDNQKEEEINQPLRDPDQNTFEHSTTIHELQDKQEKSSNTVTPEEIQKARQVNLVDYCKMKGISLLNENSRHPNMAEHDSLVFFPQNIDRQWNRYSTGEGGDSIAFLKFMAEKEGQSFDFKEAVRELNEMDNSGIIHKRRVEPKAFEYDETNERPLDKSIDYLLDDRLINPAVVQSLVNNELISENEYGGIVYKWVDPFDKSKIVGASEEGTVVGENGRFKKIQKNSQRGHGFNLLIGEPKIIHFYESPVDLLSHMSHMYEEEPQSLNDRWYVSMEGLKQNVYLKSMKKVADYIQHKADFEHIEGVHLCVDNDEPGQEFIQSLNEKFTVVTERGEEDFVIDTPPKEKDWNDFLKYKRFEELDQVKEIEHSER